MRTNKTAKKALKRLDRVEKLLSKVITQVAKDEKEVHELLDSAKASVVRASIKAKGWVKAKSPVVRKSSTEVKLAAQKKNWPKAEKRKKAHLSGKGKLQRKRILTTRTSSGSKTPRAAAVGSEAETTPERDVSAI